MKKWRRLFLALECLHLGIACLREFKRLLKRKKDKKKKEEPDDA